MKVELDIKNKAKLDIFGFVLRKKKKKCCHDSSIKFENSISKNP